MWLAASSRLPSDYFAIRNGCVSTQRLHHCVSAWPHGQALFLTLRSLTGRVMRRAATCQLHFSLALRPSTCFLSFLACSPPALRGTSACLMALNYSNRDVQHMPHHDCFQINLRPAIAVCPQRLHHCASAWPCGQALSLSFGLAAKFSLYSSARLPPALRGASACLNYSNRTVQPMVGRISIAFKLRLYLAVCNCCVSTATANRIQAWPCRQPFLRFGLLTRYFASTAIESLYFSLALRPSALSILWTAYRPRCTACSDFPNAFQPDLMAKHILSILRPAHRRPRCAARQHASTVLAIEMLTAYDWPHHDRLQITL